MQQQILCEYYKIGHSIPNMLYGRPLESRLEY